MATARSRRDELYDEYLRVPEYQHAEILGGTLYVMARPAPRHANAASVLGGDLQGPFQRGRGGPGGWWILDEPELHFPDPQPAEPGDIEAVVPDIAGWRRSRMPELPETSYFALAPDWVCEVLSKSTEDIDRNEKMPIYAREGVAHAWLIDPIARTLEAYTLGAGGRWSRPEIHEGAARVRLPPFDAIELDLSALWA